MTDDMEIEQEEEDHVYNNDCLRCLCRRMVEKAGEIESVVIRHVTQKSASRDTE